MRRMKKTILLTKYLSRLGFLRIIHHLPVWTGSLALERAGDCHPRHYILMISLIFATLAAQGQSFQLTVEGGYGSGTYEAGDTVHVWSEAVFGEDVFTNWTGSGKPYLEFDNEWHTVLIVPPGMAVEDLTISANYDAIPVSTQISSKKFSLFGMKDGTLSQVMKESFYAIPPSPKGVVFLFHGTGGRGESFFNKYERFSLVKDLVYHGYAVFTLDSNERTMGDQNGDGKIGWINSNAGTANEGNNVDILNIKSLRDSLYSTFAFPEDIPAFSVGMSAGANFSDICASALSFKASAHITAKGKTDTYTRPDIVPVIWIMSENDHNASADNAVAYSNYSAMSDAQTAEWHLFKRSPVYPERFLRSLHNVSEVQSDSIYERLQTGGYLDANNLLTVLDITLLPAPLLTGFGLTTNQQSDVKQQLLCVNADHVMHSDYNKNIVRFFNEQLVSSATESSDNRDVSVVLFPNPANNSLKIKANCKNLSVSIYTMEGKEVLFCKNKDVIDIENLACGVYVVLINADGKYYNSKIIKYQ